MPVSVCIVTNQWHPKLEAIIRILGQQVAEILIGFDDDGNMGKTPEYLNQASVKLVSLAWEGFSQTKNKLAAMAGQSWILSLDSDEVPDIAFVAALQELDLAGENINTLYRIKRLSYFEGKLIKHGAWGNDKVTRLYNKLYTCWDNAIVHESLERKADTEVRLMHGLLLHFTADDNEMFLKKARKYARLSAEKYLLANKKVSLLKLWLAPLFLFLKEYIFQSGFLDGAGGFKIATGNAKYTFWKYKLLKEQQA